jgi:hypothetical protein
MNLFSCYLERLDSLGLKHANRLKSRVGGYMTVYLSVRTDHLPQSWTDLGGWKKEK